MTENGLGLPAGPWRGLALVFNTQPALYVHESWFATLPHGACARRLSAEPRARFAVSRYLLEACELHGRYCEDFANHWARLALLDGPALELFFLYLGLALRAGELRQVIQGERLRSLKGAVGEAAWRFVVQRVPLLGVLPQFEFEPAAGDPRERFIQIGLAYCVPTLTACGPALTRRLALKLPTAWSAGLTAAAPRPGPVPAAPGLVPLPRKFINELPPPWTPLFA
jgi:hypothetical protein